MWVWRLPAHLVEAVEKVEPEFDRVGGIVGERAVDDATGIGGGGYDVVDEQFGQKVTEIVRDCVWGQSGDLSVCACAIRFR